MREYGIYSSLIFDHAPGTNPFSVLAEFKKSLSDMCRIFVECILYRYENTFKIGISSTTFKLIALGFFWCYEFTEYVLVGFTISANFLKFPI